MPVLALAALALVPLAAVELSKAMRWAALFGPHRPPLARVLRAVVAGQLTNALAPVRAGEAVRLGVLSAQGGALVPAAASLAGVKAIDALGLAAVAAALIGTAALSQAAWGVAAGSLVLVVGVGVALVGSGVRARVARWPFAERLRLAALVDVAETLRDPRTLILVVGTTAVVWVAGLLANVVVLAAVGIPPSVDLAARVLVAGYLVGFLPAPPARLGVFEAGVAVALASAGVEMSNAVGAAVTLHVCQLVELGLLFGGSLLVRRWSWSA